MFYDSKEIQDKKVVEADLCIIGGGSRNNACEGMIGLPLQVCLLESGGFDFDLDTQNLYQGASTGYDNYPVDASRMRFLGGTTNHWNGNIWPLFPDDFEQRDWIPGSGWPISREMLNAYYPKAAEVVQIKGPYSWDFDELKQYIQPIFYDPRLIENTMLDRAVFSA
ncbi:MAG: hypothetical protein IPM37_19165 [Hahellaceae bacterium]|nr:hypothetical protein [Hahellaceae bacterium]